MKILSRIIIGIVSLATVVPAVAQTEKTAASWKDRSELSLGLAINVGAAAPLPIPTEVKKIYAWYPNLNPRVMAMGTHWFDAEGMWGMTVGIGAEYKSMGATTHVDGLRIKIPGTENEGAFVGDNKTEIRSAYLTMPIMATIRLGKRQDWRLSLGLYASLIMQSSLNVVIDGDVAIDVVDGKPVTPINMQMELESFDLRSEVVGGDCGLAFEAAYYMSRRVAVTAGLSCGFVPIIKKGSDFIPYKMYNIFGNIGFSYRFL